MGRGARLRHVRPSIGHCRDGAAAFVLRYGLDHRRRPNLVLFAQRVLRSCFAIFLGILSSVSAIISPVRPALAGGVGPHLTATICRLAREAPPLGHGCQSFAGNMDFCEVRSPQDAWLGYLP